MFPAAGHPLIATGPRLRVREAHSGFGIALRYQERAPDPAGAAQAEWCETGHSIFILAARAHRHKPSVVGDEPVRYVLTEFGEAGA